MSMHPSPIEPVPEETARIARAAFRRGNLLMRIRDEIGILYDDRRHCHGNLAGTQRP
jgi:transposase